MIEFDVETTGVQWYASEVFLVTFYPDGGEPVALRHPEQRDEIQGWLDRDDDYRAWNSKFDLHYLCAAGYRLPDSHRWHDGMVAAKLLDSRQAVALKGVAERLLGDQERDTERAVKDWLDQDRKARRAAAKEAGEEYEPPTYQDVPDELMLPYALQDVVLTKRIGELQYPRITGDLQHIYQLEMKVLAALFFAESAGMPMDPADAQRLELSLAEDLENREERLRELAGKSNFNPRSSEQIHEALKRRGANLDFVTISSVSGKASMDEENLSTVDDDLAREILAYRGEYKLLTTYVRPLLHRTWDASLHAWKAPLLTDGRIHTNFRQVGTVTGRMSSSDPNVQNFPRDDLRLRYLVKADPGHVLVTADLDSIELRLFAAFAGEGRLLDAVRQEADLHTMTADFVGLTDMVRSTGAVESRRQRGKVFNYSMLYGAGVRSVRKAFRVPQASAKDMIRRYHDAYPEVRRLQRRIEYRLEDQGYVKSPYGRRFHMDPRDAYKGLNYLVQGTAADLLKTAIARLHDEGVPIVAAVHDELVAHVPEEDGPAVAAAVERALVEHPVITELVPLGAEAQIVDRWSAAKDPAFRPSFLAAV